VLVVATGTATEVGKTWWGAATLTALRRRDIAVTASKPVQSFEPGIGPTDAEILAGATDDVARSVCPEHRSLPMPVAPPMAAEALGLPCFTVSELAAEVEARRRPGITWVEGVGGPRSPIAADGDTVDLCARLRPDLVVLVAEARLGAINSVRLCAAALAPWPLVVALNRFDDGDALQHANREWLSTREGLEVMTDPEALADVIATRASIRK
jgi:dethiobiotin synthetase